MPETFLLRQKPSIIDDVMNKFHLSSEERNYMLTAGVGEGILILENDHTELKVIASEELLTLDRIFRFLGERLEIKSSPAFSQVRFRRE